MAKMKAKKVKTTFDSNPRLAKDGKVVRMTSALEKMQRLQEQMDEVKAEAIAELQAKREEAAAVVANFDRQIAELTDKKARKAKNTAAKKAKDGVCPVCKFKTSPLHDGRKHRGQGDNRKPFAASELAKMELTKVS